MLGPEGGQSRWTTSSSEIGRGVLMYGEQRRLEARQQQIRSDALMAEELARKELGSTSAGPATLVCLPLDRTSLMARPPTVPPSAEESRQDFSALEQRLRDFNLSEIPVSGDGSCQFRALSYAMWGSDERHGEVRRKVCDQLEKEHATYSPYVIDESWASYLKRMHDHSTWGDHLTLQAFADAYKRPVHLVTSYEQRGFIQISPSPSSPASRSLGIGVPLLLGFWAEVHYNPLASR